MRNTFALPHKIFTSCFPFSFYLVVGEELTKLLFIQDTATQTGRGSLSNLIIVISQRHALLLVTAGSEPRGVNQHLEERLL